MITQPVEQKKHFKLNKVQLHDTPRVLITNELLNKIWYLCHKINDVEWSGILYYKSEGDLSDITNLKFECFDFYLMDRGTGAYTEYESDTDGLMYKMKNKYLPPAIKEGKLHSHNSMQVFHSSTDLDDLYEYSEGQTYYLSLIVNNKGEFDCKLAWWGSREIEQMGKFTYTGGDGNLVEFSKTNTIKEDCIFVCNCIIENQLDSEFKDRVDEIIKKSLAKKNQQTIFGNYGKQGAIPFKSFTHADDEDYEENTFVSPHTKNFVNSPENINKHLVKFIKAWLKPTVTQSESSLLDCLTELDFGRTELTEEQYDEFLDTLEAEFDLIAEEVYGKNFSRTFLLASKAKQELESYSVDFPELVFDLSELLSEIMDPQLK